MFSKIFPASTSLLLLVVLNRQILASNSALMLHTLVAFLSDLFIHISWRPVEIKMTVGRRKGSSPTISKCSKPVDVKVGAYDCAQRSSDSPDSLFRLQVKKQCRYVSGVLSWHSKQVGLVVGMMWCTLSFVGNSSWMILKRRDFWSGLSPLRRRSL